MLFRSKYGWSAGFKLNEARPEWTDENEAAKGMKIGIYGKNLDSSEFGGKTDTKVALYDGENAYEMPVISVNPFRAEFYISENIPNNKYQVFVSNDGGESWVKNAALDQELEVYDKTEDPLGLNVGWANQFEWDKVYNVKDFGAKGDGKNDDRAAIQAAIDKAHEDGGGVAYMPAGNYIISDMITMPGRVVLEGESRDKTTVTFSYKGEDKSSKQVIAAVGEGESEGRNGLARFTLTDDNTVNPDWPDFYVWLGNGWDKVSKANGRTADYIFIKDFNLSYNFNRSGKGRAYGVNVLGDSHMLMEGCNFKGNVASMVFSMMSKYSRICNNDFYTAMTNLGNNGIYQVISNNYIKRFQELRNDDEYLNTQGIFMRGPCYVSDNYIRDIGCDNENDGEVLCSENAGGGTKTLGTIVSATKNTVKIDAFGDDSLYDWSYDNPQWGEHYALWIVNGRGLGQWAKILNFDKETMTFTLDRDFVITPDKTSRFVTNTISEGVIFYKNECLNAEKGYWLFGDTFNCVIADNKGTNCEGVFIWGMLSDNSLVGNYFSRITRNSFTGVSPKKKLCGIYMDLWVIGKPRDLIATYGIEYRDNVMKDAPYEFDQAAVENTHDWTESNDFSGLHITHNFTDSVGKSPTLQKAFLIEGNQLTNYIRGIALGAEFNRKDYMRINSEVNATSDIIIRNNQMTDTKEEYAIRYANRVKFVK